MSFNPPSLGPSAAVVHGAETVKLLNQVLHSTNRAAAASLAGGIIAASGRPYSVGEAMELLQTVSFTMNPAPNYGNYQAWAAEKDAHLAKVWS